MLIIILRLLCLLYLTPGFSTLKSSDDYVPCERGWYYFRDKCYRVSGARKTSGKQNWVEALARCKNYGADLVSIHSQEEQDFIVAFLLLNLKWWAWTGLNDRDKEGDFKWTDRSISNYSNWASEQPPGVDNLGTEEDCVHLFYDRDDTGKFMVGRWNVRSCESESATGLCEKNSNPRKRSPNMMYCSPEEGGGLKHEKSCYHIVTEMKPWQDAERHCKIHYNGHLLTLRDTMEDYFIELAIPDIRNKETWIGIKIQEQLQQKWSSGWYVSYDGFSKDEKNFIEGTCVARKKQKEWVTVRCSRPLPFICEVSEESPPVLKPAPVGAHCPRDLDDWRDLGGEYCYYIETKKSLNFYKANFDCQRRGGQMLSLHSQEEADILQPFVLHKKREIFIGLIRHKAYNDEAFGWTDGSTLDYENWAHNEPNYVDEQCVHYLTRTKGWHDIPCERDYLGYICSVKKIVPSSSLVDDSSNCKSFCVAPFSYLYGLISQCPDAKEIF